MRSTYTNRGKLRYWLDTLLTGVGAACIVGTASRFDQWLSDRKSVNLWVSLAYFFVGCVTFFSPRERSLVVAGSFGLVALLGGVNAVLSRNFVAAPLIVVSAVVFVLALRWHDSKTS